MVNRIHSYYSQKSVLVTGAGGFIGSVLVKKLNRLGAKVIALDSKTDIRNKKIWTKWLSGIDILFHLAAQTSSNFSNQNPLLDAKINLLPIINLIDTCRRYHYSPDIIFSGTVTQVGLTKTYPVNESFKDEPITVYDINKLAAEKYLQFYSNLSEKRAVILRLANVYGPGLGRRKKDRGVLNSFISEALQNKPITVYENWNYKRDYIFIDDVVEAFLAAGEKIDRLTGNYCIIGNEQGRTVNQAVNLIKRTINLKTGKKVIVRKIPAPKNLSPIEKRNFIADSNFFKNKTNWKAKTNLIKGINKTIDYYLKIKDCHSVQACLPTGRLKA